MHSSSKNFFLICTRQCACVPIIIHSLYINEIVLRSMAAGVCVCVCVCACVRACVCVLVCMYVCRSVHACVRTSVWTTVLVVILATHLMLAETQQTCSYSRCMLGAKMLPTLVHIYMCSPSLFGPTLSIIIPQMSK